MLKTLTFSLSLAVVLGVSSLSMAAGHHNNYASEQSAPVATSQCYPSSQSVGCGETCGPVKKKCCLSDLFKHKPKEYTYEWVLKKKKVHKPLFGHKNKGCGGCGESTCNTCGVYPTSQSYPSGQGYASGQGYGSPQGYGSGQAYGAGQGAYGAGQMEAPAPVTAPAGVPEPPAAPEAPANDVPPVPAAPAAAPTANAGGLLFLSPAGN